MRRAGQARVRRLFSAAAALLLPKKDAPRTGLNDVLNPDGLANGEFPEGAAVLIARLVSLYSAPGSAEPREK